MPYWIENTIEKLILEKGASVKWDQVASNI